MLLRIPRVSSLVVSFFLVQAHHRTLLCSESGVSFEGVVCPCGSTFACLQSPRRCLDSPSPPPLRLRLPVPWQTTLAQVFGVTSVLHDVQSRWLTLEGLFRVPSLMSVVPAESRLFLSLDRSFRAFSSTLSSQRILNDLLADHGKGMLTLQWGIHVRRHNPLIAFLLRTCACVDCVLGHLDFGHFHPVLAMAFCCCI